MHSEAIRGGVRFELADLDGLGQLRTQGRILHRSFTGLGSPLSQTRLPGVFEPNCKLSECPFGKVKSSQVYT